MATGSERLEGAEQRASTRDDDALPVVLLAVANDDNATFRQKKLAEAEPYMLEGLRLTEAALGSDHPEVGTACGNVSVLYAEMGRLKEAEAYMLRGHAIDEAIYGENHLHQINSLINESVFYINSGQYEAGLETAEIG